MAVVPTSMDTTVPTPSHRRGPIVTLTLSPALDVASSVDLIKPWRKLRCDGVHAYPGGGGINVARAVHELGGDTIAIAALGGHVGSLVADQLVAAGIELHRIPVAASTRQSFLVEERSTGRQFRFVHPDEPMTSAEWQSCLDATVDAATGAGLVVASGSIPPGVPDDVFARLGRRLGALGVPFIVDTSGPALVAAAAAPLVMVKPSVNELQALAGTDVGLDDDSRIESAARSLFHDAEPGTNPDAPGPEMVVVSLGERGALLVPRGQSAVIVTAPTVEAHNSSGAGDSMVAGFAVAFCAGLGPVDAVRFGVAAGTAATLTAGSGVCRRADMQRLLVETTSSPLAAMP